MTLDRIFRLVNYISAKVISGNTLTPTNFNDLLPMVSDLILNTELAKLVQDELTPIPDTLLSTSPLRPFRTKKSLTIPAGGEVDVPSDYVRWTSFVKENSGIETDTSLPPPPTPSASPNAIREIRVLSDHNAVIQQGNVFARASVKNFCFSTGSGFKFVPYDMGTAVMNYIRKPATAYFDYCYDSSYNVIYMPVGSRIYLNDANVPCLYSSTNALLASNVSKTGVTTYPYTSLSVETEWEERVHPVIVAQILKKVGVNLSDDKLFQMITENSNI